MCIRKLVTGPEFHAKTLSRSGVIKKNPPGGVYTPLPRPQKRLKGSICLGTLHKEKKRCYSPSSSKFFIETSPAILSTKE